MDYKKKRIAEAFDEVATKKSKSKQQKKSGKAYSFLPSIQDLSKTLRKFNYKSLFDVGTTNGKLFLIAISITLSIIVHQFLNSVSLDVFSGIKDLSDLSDIIPKQSIVPPKRKPIYWTYAEESNDADLSYIHRVMERLGLEHGNNRSDWDLLWAHNFIYNAVSELKSHQKVNHYPGSAYITNKAALLSTQNVYNYIQKSFNLPTDEVQLLEYSRQNPEKLFIQKTADDLEITVKTYEELDLEATNSAVHVFIDNPLLIDGHKFDIGVYVMITSVNPLRAYIYKRDVALRFCSEKFLPFNAIISEKYAANREYLPTWKLPTYSQFNQLLGFNRKDSFNAYLGAQGIQNPEIIWTKIEDAIRLVLLEREPLLLDTASLPQNFFQMMRFNLMIDDQYNVYILEAIMSPVPLSSEDVTFHEQVLYNLLNLVGVGTPIERDSFRNSTKNVEDMISTNKDIAVYPEICGNEPCTESCTSTECHLCLKCLSPENAAILHASYREHMTKGDTKRIFPLATTELDEEWMEALNPKNQFMSRWFHGKCLLDQSWCF